MTILEKLNLRRIFAITGISSLVLCYSLLWLRMITTPIECTGADYIAFYAAGRIAQSEGPAYIYNLTLQQKYEQEVVGFDIHPEHISPYLHPPFVVPLAQAVAGDDFVLSFICWDLFMLAFLAAGALPLAWLIREGLSRRQWLVGLAGILLFFPAFVSLINGQDSAILYLGAALWMLGLLKGRDWLAGTGLALMLIRPHLALLLALPFLFRRRGIWWWFLLGGSLLGLISLAYAGLDGVSGFLQILLVSGRGVNYHTGAEHMVNSIGLLLRLLPGVDPLAIHTVGWGLYILTMAGLCVWWARVPRIAEPHINLAVVLSLFAAPHLHYHDLIILSIPMACLIIVAVRGKTLSARDAVLLPLGVSLVLLFSFFSEALKYSLCYLVMLFLALAVWFPDKILRRQILRVKGRS